MTHYVARSFVGKTCGVCGASASHEVAENPHRDDFVGRIELKTYLCCEHFGFVFGELGRDLCQKGLNVTFIDFRPATIVRTRWLHSRPDEYGPYVVQDETGEQYVFQLDKVEGYRGQNPDYLGLVEGAEVLIRTANKIVTAVKVAQ